MANLFLFQSVRSAVKSLASIPYSTSDQNVFRALRLSVWDGAFFCAMLALTDTFAVAAAVKLNAPSIAIGLLAGLPLLTGSIGQLVVARYFRSNARRKKYVLIGTSGQSIFLFIVGMTGFLPESMRAWSYVLSFTMQGFFANVIGGLWTAWMSDLVDEKQRGRYFAFRNRVINTAQLFCGLGAGALAFRHTITTSDWTFFAMIFSSACLMRLISTMILRAQYEPPVQNRAETGLSPVRIRSAKPFLYFSIATAMMQGSVMLCSPFFNVWSVRDLHFNYFSLAISTSSTVLGSILALPFWGRASDRFGHFRLFLLTGLLIAIVPFPFLFTGNVVLICIINFFTGVVWSGYNLTIFNHMLFLCEPQKAERQISLANAMTGIAVFIFSLIGGAIAPILPKIMTWQLQSLFLLSGILRVGVYLALYPGIPKHRYDKTAIKDHLRFLLRRARDSR
jgi:MFS family permease